jgi:methionine aminopeptidase
VDAREISNRKEFQDLQDYCVGLSQDLRAIEPMVTQGDPEVVLGGDGWVVSTRDQGLAAHFEHTVAITASGPRILTRRNA